MFRDTDGIAFDNEQGDRARRLFAAVVMAVMEDAVKEEKKTGRGASDLASWARSRDGRTVLSCAGIEPNERTVEGMMNYVRSGGRQGMAEERELPRAA
jgi:hypothetical protein